MLDTHQAMQDRESFFEEHNPHVRLNAHYLFCDGAVMEENPQGLMSPPPEDDYERAKLKNQYHEIVAKLTEEAFVSFKNYLQGNGFSDVILYTDEEKLAHLKQLQRKATAARTKALKAKRDVQAVIPEWMQDSDDVDTEESARKATFQQAVDEIDL